jgi:hypothetical protein
MRPPRRLGRKPTRCDAGRYPDKLAVHHPTPPGYARRPARRRWAGARAAWCQPHRALPHPTRWPHRLPRRRHRPTRTSAPPGSLAPQTPHQIQPEQPTSAPASRQLASAQHPSTDQAATPAPAITDDSHRRALLSTRNLSDDSTAPEVPVASRRERVGTMPLRRRPTPPQRPCQKFARNYATRDPAPPPNPTLDSASHLRGCAETLGAAWRCEPPAHRW